MSVSNVFFTLYLKNIPASKEEAVSYLAFEFGCNGISQDLEFQQEGPHYLPESIASDSVHLKIYFEAEPKQELIDQLQMLIPQLEWSVSEHVQEDWMKKWKEGFDSFELVPGHWVVPSWRETPTQVPYVLRLDPGMAFGTGTHETTALAAQALFNQAHANSFSTFLDVGCGSGILAILASQLCIRKVFAVEVDEDARRVARENVAINGALNVEVLDAQLEQVIGTFEFVVANIIDGILVDLQWDLFRVTKPNGFLLVTGILNDRTQSFFMNFRISQNLRLVQSFKKGDWSGYLFQKTQYQSISEKSL